MTFLREFRAAMVAIGGKVLPDFAEGPVIYAPPGAKDDDWWGYDGETEDGLLAFVLRDAVRRVAPGSYCHPTYEGDRRKGRMTVRLSNEEGDMYFGTTPYWPRAIFGDTETQAWAKALIELHKAFLLK